MICRCAAFLPILLAAPSQAQQMICPTDWQGKRTSSVCWKEEKPGLYRRWDEVRQRYLPGDTLRIEGDRMKSCDFAGRGCKPVDQSALGADRK